MGIVQETTYYIIYGYIERLPKDIADWEKDFQEIVFCMGIKENIGIGAPGVTIWQHLKFSLFPTDLYKQPEKIFLLPDPFRRP